MKRHLVAHALRVAVLAASGLGALTVSAQVGPSPAEATAYRGLHAAAHKGDEAAIEKLAATKSGLDARDSNGRTPLHVATFARQREAIRALAPGSQPAGSRPL